MFDKFKDDWRNKKIQKHVQDNRNAYIAGGSGLAVGALGVLLLTRAPMQINNNVTPVIAPIFNNDNSSAVNFGGYASKIVQCIEHPERIWTSVTESALANGDSVHAMSRHLNDHTPDYNGLHYRIIGQTTSATAS